MHGQAGAPVPPLLIFDCDGVLVDSEVISAEVLSDVLRAEGLGIDETFVFSHFLGRSMDSVREVLADHFAHRLTEEALTRIRAQMERRLASDLSEVRGVGAALRRISGPRCVASSSRPERIRLSLRITGLLDLFEPNIFSATMVKRGKPEPDLFLHAASIMHARPCDCTVIEDSPAGVLAAKRAGMRVFAFTGGAHAFASNLHSALAALEPDVIFDDMDRLPVLLAEEPRSH